MLRSHRCLLAIMPFLASALASGAGCLDQTNGDANPPVETSVILGKGGGLRLMDSTPDGRCIALYSTDDDFEPAIGAVGAVFVVDTHLGSVQTTPIETRSAILSVDGDFLYWLTTPETLEAAPVRHRFELASGTDVVLTEGPNFASVWLKPSVAKRLLRQYPLVEELAPELGAWDAAWEWDGVLYYALNNTLFRHQPDREDEALANDGDWSHMGKGVFRSAVRFVDGVSGREILAEKPNTVVATLSEGRQHLYLMHIAGLDGGNTHNGISYVNMADPTSKPVLILDSVYHAAASLTPNGGIFYYRDNGTDPRTYTYGLWRPDASNTIVSAMACSLPVVNDRFALGFKDCSGDLDQDQTFVAVELGSGATVFEGEAAFFSLSDSSLTGNLVRVYREAVQNDVFIHLDTLGGSRETSVGREFVQIETRAPLDYFLMRDTEHYYRYAADVGLEKIEGSVYRPGDLTFATSERLTTITPTDGDVLTLHSISLK